MLSQRHPQSVWMLPSSLGDTGRGLWGRCVHPFKSGIGGYGPFQQVSGTPLPGPGDVPGGQTRGPGQASLWGAPFLNDCLSPHLGDQATQDKRLSLDGTQGAGFCSPPLPPWGLETCSRAKCQQGWAGRSHDLAT